MCFGAETAIIAPLLSAGLGVAGQAITMSEQQRQAEAQAEARNEELRRTLLKNDDIAQQTRNEFANRLTTAEKSRIDDQQRAAAKSRTKEGVKAAKATPEMKENIGASISGSAPKIVQSDLASRMSEVARKNKKQAAAQGELSAYGDSWLKQGFSDTQSGRDLGTLTNFAAGNSAILPYAQDFAELKATKPISPLGAIIGGIGNMYGSWAGSQQNPVVPRKTYTSPFIG